MTPEELLKEYQQVTKDKTLGLDSIVGWLREHPDIRMMTKKGRVREYWALKRMTDNVGTRIIEE